VGQPPQRVRPAHIHFSLLGRSFEQRLVTQMHFPGDPLFPYDPIFNSVRDSETRERMIGRFSIDASQDNWSPARWRPTDRDPESRRVRSGRRARADDGRFAWHDVRVWGRQAPLADRFWLVRFDHRGHGGSPVPPAPYEIADPGMDVLELMDALGLDHVSYCDLSIGGTVGMWLGAHAPAGSTA
jgi:hypothetical protein